MANPIVGALFFGLFTGTPGSGMPVGHLVVDTTPTPQCVFCGPANRRNVATIYDWSNPRATTHYLRQIDRSAVAGGEATLSDWRLGMAEEQLQRLALYSGV